MNDQECLRAYETLGTILSENGLVWIISQVEEQIRLGKTVEREIETLKDVRETGLQSSSSSLSNLKKGPRAKFPVTESYSSPEQLKVMIDAIERAVLDSATMENHLAAFMENSDGNRIREIQFYDEEAGIKRQSIERGRADMRIGHAKHLKGLLDTLRKEIDNQ